MNSIDSKIYQPSYNAQHKQESDNGVDKSSRNTTITTKISFPNRLPVIKAYNDGKPLLIRMLHGSTKLSDFNLEALKKYNFPDDKYNLFKKE